MSRRWHSAIRAAHCISRHAQSNRPHWTGLKSKQIFLPLCCTCLWVGMELLQPILKKVLIAKEHQSFFNILPPLSQPSFQRFVFMLSVRVSSFGTRVLPPTKSWATYLWATNIVPCRGTEAREKVKGKSTPGIQFLFSGTSCCSEVAAKSWFWQMIEGYVLSTKFGFFVLCCFESSCFGCRAIVSGHILYYPLIQLF